MTLVFVANACGTVLHLEYEYPRVRRFHAGIRFTQFEPKSGFSNTLRHDLEHCRFSGEAQHSRTVPNSSSTFNQERRQRIFSNSPQRCSTEFVKKINQRIIFMSMFNDIDWHGETYRETTLAYARQTVEFASHFREGHFTLCGPGRARNWWESKHGPQGVWYFFCRRNGQDLQRQHEVPILSCEAPMMRGPGKRKETWTCISSVKM